MSVSKELVGSVLVRFALLFDAPVAARADWGAAVDCWVRLLGGVPEADFLAHAKSLALTLSRFPVPGDFAALLPPFGDPNPPPHFAADQGAIPGGV